MACARRLIAELHETLCLPVILVGRYATCRSEDAISMPGVLAVVRGEYERPLLRLLKHLRDAGTLDEPLPGIWHNSEDGLVRAEMDEPLADLDALPLARRDLFDPRAADDAGEPVLFQAVRGCPRWCAHCLNDWYVEMYAGRGPWLRRRGVRSLLAEIDAVQAELGELGAIAFHDHAFADDPAWLAELADALEPRGGPGFRCHVRLASLAPETPRLLARAGATDVDVEIGSASNFIREEVLGLRTTRHQIVEGVAALRRQGLAVHAGVFVGAPYDSELAIDETLDLLLSLDLDTIRPRVYYPIPGTRAAELCQDNGWISGRAEQEHLADRSVLDMPQLPARRISEVVRRYESMLKSRGNTGVLGLIRRIRRLGSRPLSFRRRAKR